MPIIWEIAVVISVLGGAVTGLWFFQDKIRSGWRWLADWLQPDLLEDIFSPEADVEVVSDDVFESNIKERADEAGERIDRISVHMYTIDRIEEENLRNPRTEHRILLLKPTSEGDVGKNRLRAA